MKLFIGLFFGFIVGSTFAQYRILESCKSGGTFSIEKFQYNCTPSSEARWRE